MTLWRGPPPRPQVVQKLTQMVGKNVKLYDMVLQFLRTLFLRTRNVHYCTLRAELLMSLHELDVGDICSVDPCHKVLAAPAPPPSFCLFPVCAPCPAAPLCQAGAPSANWTPGQGASSGPYVRAGCLDLPCVPAPCLPLLQLGPAPWPFLDACSGFFWGFFGVSLATGAPLL